MGIWGAASFGVALLAWASYLWVNKVPSLRRTMWPLWALFALSIALATAAIVQQKSELDFRLALGTLACFGLFVLAYFLMMRTPRAAGRPQAGAALPPIRFVTESGAILSPDDYAGKGPLLLVFFRGFW